MIAARAAASLWASHVVAAPIRFYRYFLSPWLGSACRFEPTCSVYALEALDRHGAARGSYLAAGRLLRCHPGCAGGPDPVPALVTPASELDPHST